MYTIRQYELTFGITLLTLPKVGEILTIKLENNRLLLWYIYDQHTVETQVCKFITILDNISFTAATYTYITTVQDMYYTYHHIFELH